MLGFSGYECPNGAPRMGQSTHAAGPEYGVVAFHYAVQPRSAIAELTRLAMFSRPLGRDYYGRNPSGKFDLYYRNLSENEIANTR